MCCIHLEIDLDAVASCWWLLTFLFSCERWSAAKQGCILNIVDSRKCCTQFKMVDKLTFRRRIRCITGVYGTLLALGGTLSPIPPNCNNSVPTILYKPGLFSCFLFATAFVAFVTAMIVHREFHLYKPQFNKWSSYVHVQLFHPSRVYYEPTKWPALRWLVSLASIALHRYRRGHGFDCYTNLNFFGLSFRCSFSSASCVLTRMFARALTKCITHNA